MPLTNLTANILEPKPSIVLRSKTSFRELENMLEADGLLRLLSSGGRSYFSHAFTFIVHGAPVRSWNSGTSVQAEDPMWAHSLLLALPTCI
jgi:hypothetical protein